MNTLRQTCSSSQTKGMQQPSSSSTYSSSSSQAYSSMQMVPWRPLQHCSNPQATSSCLHACSSLVLQAYLRRDSSSSNSCRQAPASAAGSAGCRTADSACSACLGALLLVLLVPTGTMQPLRSLLGPCSRSNCFSCGHTICWTHSLKRQEHQHQQQPCGLLASRQCPGESLLHNNCSAPRQRHTHQLSLLAVVAAADMAAVVVVVLNCGSTAAHAAARILLLDNNSWVPCWATSSMQHACRIRSSTYCRARSLLRRKRSSPRRLRSHLLSHKLPEQLQLQQQQPAPGAAASSNDGDQVYPLRRLLLGVVLAVVLLLVLLLTAAAGLLQLMCMP